MPGLRIGINALYLIPGGVGGTQIYLESLLKALEASNTGHRYFIFVNQRWSPVFPTGSNFEVIRCRIDGRFRPARILYEQLLFPFQLRKYRIDALLNAGFTSPLLRPCPAVTVFHDLQHKRHPEFFRWFDLPFWNLLLWGAARSSEKLIAVSQATASDLASYYPGTASKTAIVPHGVDPAMFQVGRERESRVGPGTTRFLLVISTSHPHKNLHRLLQAFAMFHANHPEFRLVIVGVIGFAHQSLLQLCTSLGLNTAVEFTGWIAREDLLGLVRDADAFLYPTLFEGFGLPVVEALAAGLPTACSAIEPLMTLAGGAAHLFDSLQVPQILAAMERITGDPSFRNAARVRGPATVSNLTWEAAARATEQQLEAAIGA